MRLTAAALVVAASLCTTAQAATVKVDPSTAPWLGFMNVFELPSNGGGFVFNSGWGVPDLTATFNDAANTLTLGPNTIGDPDPFWYQGGGGPGAPGNKSMEANLFQQVTGGLSGMLVTFEGVVVSNTFTQAHTAKIFIRDFAPDFSSFNEQSIPLVPGAFSLTLGTIPDPARHVQWGFQVRGENVWFTDVAPFGTAVIRTIPGPGSLALLGLGLAGSVRRRR